MRIYYCVNGTFLIRGVSPKVYLGDGSWVYGCIHAPEFGLLVTEISLRTVRHCIDNFYRSAEIRQNQ